MSATSVVSFRQFDEVDDPLTAVLRSSACRSLVQAIKAEAFLAAIQGEWLPGGRERIVRYGHGPERLIAVQWLKLRDRAAGKVGAERVRYTPAFLPR